MPIPRSFVVATTLVLLAACQTTSTSPEERAARTVEIFVEHCLNFVGYPERRLENLAYLTMGSDDVTDFTDIIDEAPTNSPSGIRVWTYGIEDGYQVTISRLDSRYCLVSPTSESPQPSMEEMTAALRSRVNTIPDGGRFGRLGGEESPLFTVEAHPTTVSGSPQAIDASVVIIGIAGMNTIMLRPRPSGGSAWGKPIWDEQ